MNGSDRTTMDFFEHQDKARRKTGMLVFLFLAAVVLIIVAVYIAVSVALFLLSQKAPSMASYNVFNLKAFAYIAGGTILLVAFGSLYKIAALGKGGDAVAKMLGGARVETNTQNPEERKLLNVVEEIAIASGVQVPLVYVLNEEEGINAFAAGYSPSAAVIGVTRGAIENLSRDELQGVIAHEFSHILNGDMRLNLRLMGILHGILLIGITGRVLLEIVLRGGGRRVQTRRKKDGGGGGVLVILGLGFALLVIGYIGVFFGKLIKAAVSRQREFLADASSVQFTRNPGGLSGALKKMGMLFKDMGSKLHTPHAEEASHMFFGNALSGFLASNLLATHPPLDKRIRAIDPAWDGQYIQTPEKKMDEKPEIGKFEEALAGLPISPWPVPILQGPAKAPGQAGNIPLSPQNFIKQIGVLSSAQIAQAGETLSRVPEEIRNALRTPDGAKAVLFSLLLNREEEPRKKQLDYLSSAIDAHIPSLLGDLGPKLESLGSKAHLTLLDLAMPTFRQMAPEEAGRLIIHVENLINADQKVTLFEYTLGKILRKTLYPVITGKTDKAQINYYSFEGMIPHISILLSMLVHEGNKTDEMKQLAFNAGVKAMSIHPQDMSLEPEKNLSFEILDKVLDTLRQAAPNIKKRLMEGLAACAAVDQVVTLEEGELLRAIADTLDCPVPPLQAASLLLGRDL